MKCREGHPSGQTQKVLISKYKVHLYQAAINFFVINVFHKSSLQVFM